MPRVKELKIYYMVTDLPYKWMEIRKRAKMSQQEVADAIGCTRQFVSMVERGEAVPGYKVLIRFLAATKPDDEVILNLMKGWDE